MRNEEGENERPKKKTKKDEMTKRRKNYEQHGTKMSFS